MSLIKELHKNVNLIRYYRLDNINETAGSISWIDSVRKIRDLETDEIFLHDEVNLSEDDSGDIEFDGDVITQTHCRFGDII